MEPITPQEVNKQKHKYLPEYVIQAFNELIAEKFFSGEARIKQEEAVSRILALCPDEKMTSSILFERHYLDVEDIYRDQGWKVMFDQPGYNESGTSVFKFIDEQYKS